MRLSPALTRAGLSTPSSGIAAKATTKATTDEALVGLIAQGDQSAMQVLFGRHNVRVFRFLMRLVDGEAAARGPGERGFHRGLAQCRPVRGAQPGFHLAAGDRPPQGAVGAAAALDDELDEDVIEFIEDPSDNPEVALQKTERAEILRDCLKQLSPAHREIIDLVYYHERTIEDVAEIIGVPQNTVKTRMFYARKRIGELLAARGLDRACL